jgi:hypothetical protein
MTDDRTTGQPEHWDKDQMETDDPGDVTGHEATGETSRATWNKGEVAEEHQDGTGGPHGEPVEPAGGLSGEGSNPGGGERWADRDAGSEA